MHNRIYWVIENERPKREPTALQQNPTGLTLGHEESHAKDGSTPWAIFGPLGHTEREAMQRIYEAGIEKDWAARENASNAAPTTLAWLAPDGSFASLARFRRLLADLEEADMYGDTGH